MLFNFFTLHDISSFVPEKTLLDGKHDFPCRVCHEDCVILDANNDFLPVAYRGTQPNMKENYFSFIGLSASEYSFFRSVLHTHNRILLHSPLGAILVFTEFLGETGLLLVIRPYLSVSPERSVPTLLAALHQIGETRFIASSHTAPLDPDRHFLDNIIHEQLSELFFYVDFFCNPEPFAHGIFTTSVRLANFAGCRLECLSLPFDEQSLSSSEQVRLAAFLLCVFLSLRHQADHAHAEYFSDNVSPLRYHISAFSDPEHVLTSHSLLQMEQLPFLNCACFEAFRLSLSDHSVCFDATLSNVPSLVNSIDSVFPCFSFLLEISST